MTHAYTPESSQSAVDPRQFRSFAEFYPFYLQEHSNSTCRRLHFVGSSLALLCLIALFFSGNFWFLLAGLLCGYGFAWVGHFGFEKNKPASFKRPLYSLMGDWRMYADMWRGKVRF
ncbi:Mpo1-like protein [Comamonas composti]|uniref:Mpo1-like protein n=1 Tax=Comamonas composti TaxID=408558 RepID=UPI00047CEE80|nr:Mpo1-like protein [Comamonas composti]